MMEAKAAEAKGEYGSALALYYRARDINPASTMAKAGVERVAQIIYRTKF